MGRILHGILVLALVSNLGACGKGPSERGRPDLTGAASAPEAAAASGPVELSFHDRLTGELLPASAKLSFQAGDRVLRREDLLLSLRDTQLWSEPGANWSYSIPGPEEALIMHEEVRAFPPDERGRVQLPYSCGVRGRILGEDGTPLSGVQVTAYSLSARRLQEMSSAFRAAGTPELIQPFVFLLARYRDEYGDPPSRSCVTDAKGRYSLSLPSAWAEGLQVMKAGYRVEAFRFEPEPGTRTEKDFVLKKRPIVEGSVSSPDGVPLEGVSVRITVFLDPAHADLSPEDRIQGIGMAQESSPDRTPRLYATLRAKTDSVGHYESILPTSLGIAVLAVHGDGYAVQERESLSPDTDIPIRIDLELQRPSRVPVIRILGNHRPLTGAVVVSTIVDDPRGLQFPNRSTDQKGEVRLPWLESAERWGIFVDSARIRDRSFFTFLERGQEVIEIGAAELSAESHH